MITIICSSISPDPKYKEHVLKHVGLPKEKVQFLHYENKGQFSLTKLYNIGLSESVNDLVLFIHDDLIFESKQIGSKLNKLFEKNPDYGIIGLAGSKELGLSGRWWDNRSQMFGRVKHSNNGKTWASNYSPDLGKSIEETVNVDGLFFAVKKSRLKCLFNEEYHGFHFYDLVFSFENHINGVKVGVTTDISLIHKSVGETNEEWETLRLKFLNDFSDKLPIKVKQNFNNIKMEVLIGCLSFKELTGSELYVYELAKGLRKTDVNVSIISANIGEPLKSMASKLGIALHDLNSPPHYTRGDGEWSLPNGTKSVKDVLYLNSEPKFHIIHANHNPITQHLLKLYPNSKFVSSIHSEIINLENPVIDDRISKYISIRDSITEKLIGDGIEENKIIEIYNPIDDSKFNLENITDNNEILFVGTIDHLRENAIIDLVEYSKELGKKLRIVGKENGILKVNDIIDFESNDHVIYEKERLDIEKLVKSCSMVAGILRGRTSLEGLFCGKPAIMYNVDQYGQIHDRIVCKPEEINLNKYKRDFVTNEIIKLYKDVINGR